MKKCRQILIVALGLWGIPAFSCGDDNGDDASGNDTTGGGDGDTGDTDFGDTDEDADSETAEACGGDQEACCDGECDSGLDPVISPLEATCNCQPQCTFSDCTAGSAQGYCGIIFGTEDLGCINSVDIALVMTPNDCTVGDSCTTDSGDTGGTCLSLPSPMPGGEAVNRCVALCDTPPEGCESDLVCSPFVTVEGEDIVVDYTNGHCGPPM